MIGGDCDSIATTQGKCLNGARSKSSIPCCGSGRTSIPHCRSDVTSYAVDFIYILGTLGFVSFITVQSCDERIQYDPMVVFVCLYITLPHYHHCADAYASIEFLKCL